MKPAPQKPKIDIDSPFSESEFGLIASCLTFIWDILKWLVLEWKLEENQTVFGLIVAKIGAIGAILFLLWIVVLVLTFVFAMVISGG